MGEILDYGHVVQRMLVFGLESKPGNAHSSPTIRSGGVSNLVGDSKLCVSFLALIAPGFFLEVAATDETQLAVEPKTDDAAIQGVLVG